MYLASDFDSSNENAQKTKSPKQAMTELLQQKAKEALGRRRKDPCAMFLHAGSIPGTGWSYFAGQDFQAGDLLMDASHEPRLELRSNSSDDAVSSPMKVPPHALVLKHHPTLANAGGPLYYTTTTTAKEAPSWQLRATRAIAAGDELFVSYDPVLHDHSAFFDHVPRASDYRLADDITGDLRAHTP